MTTPLLPALAGTVDILVAVLLWFMPQLTRPDLFFAVTVDPAFRSTPEGRAVTRDYRLGVFVVALLTAAALAASVTGPRALAPATVYVQLVGSFFVFVRARGHVLPHAVAPTTIREAALLAHDRIVPGGWPAAAGPFAILVATAVYLRVRDGALAERSLAALGAATVTVAILALVLYGLAHWVRAVNADGTAGARELRFRRTVAALLLAIAYVVALQWSLVALRPISPDLRPEGLTGIAIGLAPLALVIAAAVLLARLGQGGSGGLSAATAAGVPVGDRIPDRYWRFGVFYCNRDDPAVFVEKRFGLGYTLNFAHVVSWLIVIVPIVLALAFAAARALRAS